nr:MAG TPA: hypothetical protein [Caudoviricetes sp.]
MFRQSNTRIIFNVIFFHFILLSLLTSLPTPLPFYFL